MSNSNLASPSPVSKPCGESCLTAAFSFRAAALAAAICCRNAADELEGTLCSSGCGSDTLRVSARFAAAGCLAGVGLVVVVREGVGMVLLPTEGRAFWLAGVGTVDFLAGVEDAATVGSFALCNLLVNPPLMLRRLDVVELMLGTLDVVRDGGWELKGAFFTAKFDRLDGLPTPPSLVPGLLPFLLRLELGRGGGPMGLSTGLKKLDRRRSLGVDGRDCRLSMVRSDSDGFADIDRAPSPAGS